MENDLISRRSLMDKIDQWANQVKGGIRHTDRIVWDVLEVVTDVICDEEVIEAEPVRHGRWDEVWCFDYMDYTHFCSECHYDALTKEGTMHDEVLSSYCPNCGARMDAKEDA